MFSWLVEFPLRFIAMWVLAAVTRAQSQINFPIKRLGASINHDLEVVKEA
jgi:hypothetical protein